MTRKMSGGGPHGRDEDLFYVEEEKRVFIEDDRATQKWDILNKPW
ncbi:hypothetical protein [Sutcliffiella horikoshii]|nr:hypothetical protein [Sutcliffiella horikoshii]